MKKILFKILQVAGIISLISIGIFGRVAFSFPRENYNGKCENCSQLNLQVISISSSVKIEDEDVSGVFYADEEGDIMESDSLDVDWYKEIYENDKITFQMLAKLSSDDRPTLFVTSEEVTDYNFLSSYCNKMTPGISYDGEFLPVCFEIFRNYYD
ncbi:hypothetical protein JW710_00345 [Candidatus Dojkabacteria bacterium]|nr:hypothetical protein [Candidatus Dojkabacteria bacterium]